MDSHVRIVRLLVVALVALLIAGSTAGAQETVGDVASDPSANPPGRVTLAPGGSSSAFPTSSSLPDLTKPQNFSAALQIVILLTVLSLAPAILIMMTSFT